jgi:adenylate cyclase
MAILAADVVGYSRLMGTDEEGTLANRKRADHHQHEEDKARQRQGRHVANFPPFGPFGAMFGPREADRNEIQPGLLARLRIRAAAMFDGFVLR